MSNEALKLAVKRAGGQSALARAIGVGQSHIWHWLEKSTKGVPAEHCAAIEKASGVSRHDLRPDIYPSPHEDASAPTPEPAS